MPLLWLREIFINEMNNYLKVKGIAICIPRGAAFYDLLYRIVSSKVWYLTHKVLKVP